jgi:hypothetical protein
LENRQHSKSNATPIIGQDFKANFQSVELGQYIARNGAATAQYLKSSACGDLPRGMEPRALPPRSQAMVLGQ